MVGGSTVPRRHRQATRLSSQPSHRSTPAGRTQDPYAARKGPHLAREDQTPREWTVCREFALHDRSDPPNEFGGSYESECRPQAVRSAQKNKKPRRQSPARPADSVRATGTILETKTLGYPGLESGELGGVGVLDVTRQIIRYRRPKGSPRRRDCRPEPGVSGRLGPVEGRAGEKKMRATGFEPARVTPREPKSRASASSATPAATIGLDLGLSTHLTARTTDPPQICRW